jgi:hypothetical protein
MVVGEKIYAKHVLTFLKERLLQHYIRFILAIVIRFSVHEIDHVFQSADVELMVNLAIWRRVQGGARAKTRTAVYYLKDGRG